jgi:hypothetical protein
MGGGELTVVPVSDCSEGLTCTGHCRRGVVLRRAIGSGDLLGDFGRQEQNLDGLAFGHIENVESLHAACHAP